MYKSVIEFNRDIPLEKLAEYTAFVNKAFDNRGGKVENSSDDPYLVIHKADDNLRICLDLALIIRVFPFVTFAVLTTFPSTTKLGRIDDIHTRQICRKESPCDHDYNQHK